MNKPNNYSQLIKSLLAHAGHYGCCDNCICYDAEDRGFATCSEELAKLAADAIETLQKEVDAHNRSEIEKVFMEVQTAE